MVIIIVIFIILGILIGKKVTEFEQLSDCSKDQLKGCAPPFPTPCMACAPDSLIILHPCSRNTNFVIYFLSKIFFLTLTWLITLQKPFMRA